MNPYQPGEDNQDPYEVGYKAGTASRDAEVVSLTNQLDYEYVRAENAEQESDQFEQERDQLREDVKMLRNELLWHKEHTYNPFEPDNQCNAHKRICEALAATEVDQRERAVEFATAREEIESLRQQLAASLAACKVKDAFLHIVTVEIRWSGDPMYEAACKALAATQDLSGLVLCEAEPVGKYTGTESEYGYQFVQLDYDVEIGTPLYKARKP